MRSLSLFLITIALLCTLTDCSPSKYPVYKSQTGSHYENGFSIGSQAKDRIQGFIAYPTLSNLRRCLLTECSVDFRDLVAYNRAIWPQYFDELRGYADGAQIEEMDVLLLTFKYEVSAMMDAILPPHDLLQCSDILLNKITNAATFQGIGHNEDGWNGTLNYAFFGEYSISDPVYNEEANQFFVFQYPASISGHAFGVNKYGVTVSMNALQPTGPNAVTIQARATYLLSRATLDAHSLDEAVGIIQDYDNAAIAYGASLNIGYRAENGQITMANVEISKNEVSVQYYGLEQEESYGYHFNMYLRESVSQKVDESSVHRLQRTQTLVAENALNTVRDVENILGDTQDSSYPIYRTSQSPDGSYTVATAIFDVGRQVLHVYEDCNPKICEQAFVFPFDSFE